MNNIFVRWLLLSFIVCTSPLIRISLEADAQEIENSDKSGQYKFELSTTRTVISQSWISGVQGRICPSPPVDVPTKYVIDPQTGASVPETDTSVSYSILRTNPNGSKTTGASSGSDRNDDFCKNILIGDSLIPEGIGNYTYYATARWIYNGSVHEIRSNEVKITVNPSIYTRNSPSEVELVQELSIASLLDWSPDGKSILVKNGNDGLPYLISPADGRLIGSLHTPMPIYEIIDAKFSPKRSDLVLVLATLVSQEDTAGLYVIDFSKNRTNTVAMSSSETSITSFAWYPDKVDDKIVYGLEEFSSGAYSGTEIWLADTEGNKVRKLFEKSFAIPSDPIESEIPAVDNRIYYFINDVNKDGSKLLMTVLESSTGFFSGGNLTIFDLENQKFKTLIDSWRVSNAQFTPSSDLIIYDIGLGYKTPGGPVVIMSDDGTWSEYYRLQEKRPYDDPQSFVVSPDGNSLVVLIQSWGGGDTRLVKSEFAHPIPEFSSTVLFAMSVLAIIGIIAMHRFRIKRN